MSKSKKRVLRLITLCATSALLALSSSSENTMCEPFGIPSENHSFSLAEKETYSTILDIVVSHEKPILPDDFFSGKYQPTEEEAALGNSLKDAFYERLLHVFGDEINKNDMQGIRKTLDDTPIAYSYAIVQGGLYKNGKILISPLGYSLNGDKIADHELAHAITAKMADSRLRSIMEGVAVYIAEETTGEAPNKMETINYNYQKEDVKVLINILGENNFWDCMLNGDIEKASKLWSEKVDVISLDDFLITSQAILFTGDMKTRKTAHEYLECILANPRQKSSKLSGEIKKAVRFYKAFNNPHYFETCEKIATLSKDERIAKINSSGMKEYFAEVQVLGEISFKKYLSASIEERNKMINNIAHTNFPDVFKSREITSLLRSQNNKAAYKQNYHLRAGRAF